MEDDNGTHKGTGITAVALYNYQATNIEEISINFNDIITDIEMIDDVCWRGWCNGHHGLFPAIYVQVHFSNGSDIEKQQITDRCVEQLKHNKWVLPALKQIRDICCYYSDTTPDFPHVWLELNEETKTDPKINALSAIMKASKKLEIFRLKMNLRLLQTSSFTDKINFLNEVNEEIMHASYFSRLHGPVEDRKWWTTEWIIEWIKENKVLQILLRDSLHQPQYVDKLEKIIHFLIKEKALTLDDLDDIWAAQHKKHESIVKNVHDLLAKLAWDFSTEQLNHLFSCFQTSWSSASKKQKKKTLGLIRHLAEDNIDYIMAQKVLPPLWSLAHSDGVPPEIMDQALNAHRTILEKHPAPPVIYRHHIIWIMQNRHSLIILIINNLTTYMENIRCTLKVSENSDLNPEEIITDGCYNHIVQVQERLSFLHLLVKDGHLFLCASQAKEIWNCLAKNAVFAVDRETCFNFFSKLMEDEPCLDPEDLGDIFMDILQLDPSLLTENGMNCFECFFRAVNQKEGKLVLKHNTFLMEDMDLIGVNYIWGAIIYGSEEIADRAIELLKETFTNLGPKLQAIQDLIHDEFLSSCMSYLKKIYDTVSSLESDKESINRIPQETMRMSRVLKVLYEFVSASDGDFVKSVDFVEFGHNGVYSFQEMLEKYSASKL